MQEKSASSDERAHAKILGARVRSLVAKYLDTIRFACDRITFLDRIERLGAELALWGSRMNLTAEPDDPQELAFHIIDSLSPLILANREDLLQHAFRSGQQVLDLGSGAGFPGLVLASISPAIFTLIESRRKRASFLASTAAEMQLKNVVVESRRLQPERLRSCHSSDSAQNTTCGHFDVVTARAFAPPPIFYLIAASALRPGGIAILYGNPGQDLGLPEAEKNGLYKFKSIAYTIPRGSRVVERILGLWQRHQTQ